MASRLIMRFNIRLEDWIARCLADWMAWWPFGLVILLDYFLACWLYDFGWLTG